MLKVYAVKRSDILYLDIRMNGTKDEIVAGVYHDRMVQYFGSDYENSKRYKTLKAQDRGKLGDGLGWYILKQLLGLKRMYKGDVYKYMRKRNKINLEEL